MVKIGTVHNVHGPAPFWCRGHTENMYYVYILLMSNKLLYTGYTTDLKRRMREHNSGSNITTRKHLPIKLIFYEAFANEFDAKRREEYFKTSKGKTTVRLMLGEFLKQSKYP